MSFNVGERVTLLRDNSTGTIRFIGYTKFKSGEWIGIELDQEFSNNGKNDGSLNGVRYFTCENKTLGKNGVFVRPSMLSKMDIQNIVEIEDEKADKLEGIVSRLDNKIMVLMNNITDLKKDLQDSEFEKDQLNDMINALQENLERELVEKNFVQDEKDDLQFRFDNLKLRYDTVYKEINDLREELNLIHEINDNSGSCEEENDNTQLKVRNKILEKTLVALKNEYGVSDNKLKKKISDMEQKLEIFSGIESKFNTCFEELEQFRNSNQLLKDKLETLSESESLIDSLTIKNEELGDKILALENKVEELEQLELIEQDLDKNRTELEKESKNYIKKLQEELNYKKSEISSLKSKNEKLEHLIANLKQNQSKKGLDDFSRPNSEEVSRLKHENSKLLKLKSDLSLQVLLKKINEDSIKGYTTFISKFAESSKFDDYFALFNFRSICSNLCDYFKSSINISSIKNAEQYSYASRSLHDFFNFQSLLNQIDSLIEISSYTYIPNATIKLIKNYSNSFEERFRSRSFEFILPTVTTDIPELTFRESSTVNANFILLKFQYSYELLKLIDTGLRLAKVSYTVSLQNLKDSIDSFIIKLQPFCEKLQKLKLSEHGLINEIKTKKIMIEADSIVDGLREINLTLEFMDVEIPNSIVLPELHDCDLPELNIIKLSIQKIWDKEKTSVITQSALLGGQETIADHGIVENLTLKLNLLQSKLHKFQDNEFKSLELKSELNDKSKENKSLISKLQDSENLLSEMETRINVLRSKLKIYGINENDKEVENIKEEFTNLDQFKMINEITQLRNLVKRLNSLKTNLIDYHSVNYNWLKIDPDFKSSKINQPWDRLDRLIEMSFDLNDRICLIERKEERFTGLVLLETEMAQYHHIC